MRLLIRRWPNVDPGNVVVLAFERERLTFCPGAHYYLLRPMEELVRACGAHAPDKILDPDSAHEAADQPPAHDVVEHRQLLGNHERMIAHWSYVAENGDFDPFGPASERRAYDIR